jgi:PAS domain S-box-containing protein
MKYNVLYVDDEHINLSGFELLFRKKFNIITASSGLQGLEILASQPIHVVVTDQRMPDMNGLDFLKKVKNKWPDLKNILLTAYDDAVVVKEAINKVGIFWYVDKPFDPDQMEQIIHNAIAAYQAENKLKESEEKFRGVFNSMTDTFTRADLNGICSMVSPSIYDLIGYTQEEVLGRDLAEFYVDPEQRERITRNLFGSKKVENFEIDVVRKDGIIITVSTNAKIVFDGEGEPLYIEGNIRDISKQKNAEEKLRRSEQKFKDIFNSITDVFSRRSLDGKIEILSPSIYNLTGYTVKEVMGQYVSKFYVDPNQPEILKELVLEYGKVENFESQIFKKDGEIITISINANIRNNKEGYPFQIESVFRDITSLKKAEEKLMHSEELHRITVERAALGIVHVAPDGKFIRINNKFCEITGYSKDELMSKPFANITHPDDVEYGLKQVRRLIDGEIDIHTAEKRYIHKDGHIVYVNLISQLFRLASGEPNFFVSIIEDITERKKAQSEHDTLFNVSFDLLCIAGFDGYFKQLNPAWEKTTGYTLEELKEKRFKDFIHKDDWDKTSNEIKDLLEGKITSNFQNRYKRKNGEIIYLSWTITPSVEEKLMYCIARDVTDQKKAEREILAYQYRLQKLAQELTVAEEKVRKQIAVDLHDHVGQLLSSVRMQMSRIIDLEDNAEITVRMKNISQALLKAIQSTRAAIFDLSPPQLNEIGLYAAVHDWTKEQIEQKHKIITTIDGEYEVFEMEENTRYLLFRSIKELVINVIKHARADRLNITFKRINKALEITIEDDGVGFNYNPDLLKLRSNSLGLFSIQERMSDLGGSMEVNSIIDKGTKIKLTVPLQNHINEN